MSAALKTIPKDARLVELVAGTINAPGEPNHGAPASFEVREAYCAGTITRWLIIRVAPSGKPERFGWAKRSYWCKRATGRNIAKLNAQLPELRALIQAPA